ncbi:MAG: CRISPR-associated endonuclease Cas2 [Cyclobacteriaceae bacterium]
MIKCTRINQYRAMWVLVAFDLPTETKKDTRNYRKFVDVLEKDGFARFQFSIFIRHCPSLENAKIHSKRVKINLPPKGKVGIVQITDRQFGLMEVFSSAKKDEIPAPTQQLELF